MKYLVAIFIIFIVIFLFIFSLTHIGDYGSFGFVTLGLSGYAIYKIFQAMAEGYKGDGKSNTNSSGNRPYNNRATYTGGSSSKEDDEIDNMIMMDMMDGELDGKFDFFDKD